MTSTVVAEWFFSSPVERFNVRRGDPLGLRADADRFADQLAPGLSNRTVDGRWITILCWALQQANNAARRFSVNDDSLPREVERERYSWLRPLELLWVARTVRIANEAVGVRQLPGVRSISDWAGSDDTRVPPQFNLSDHSYARYRFTGLYGAYRVALRSLPGLTKDGDGWTLDEVGVKLADLVKKQHVKCAPLDRGRGKPPSPESYWQRSFDWTKGRVDFLPTVLLDLSRLEDYECSLLQQALFSPSDTRDANLLGGKRRRDVVNAAANSSATTRHELFKDIAHKLEGGTPLPRLRLLSAFCELADAGAAAIDSVLAAAQQVGPLGVPTDEVVSGPAVCETLDQLLEAAKRWQRECTDANQSIPVADELAESIRGAKKGRRQQLENLVRHHDRRGGGPKWLTIEKDRAIPLAPNRGGQSSQYPFRLWALCRLGIQTGLIKSMPRAIHGSDSETADLEDQE